MASSRPAPERAPRPGSRQGPWQPAADLGALLRVVALSLQSPGTPGLSPGPPGSRDACRGHGGRPGGAVPTSAPPARSAGALCSTGRVSRWGRGAVTPHTLIAAIKDGLKRRGLKRHEPSARHLRRGRGPGGRAGSCWRIQGSRSPGPAPRDRHRRSLPGDRQPARTSLRPLAPSSHLL